MHDVLLVALPVAQYNWLKKASRQNDGDPAVFHAALLRDYLARPRRRTQPVPVFQGQCVRFGFTVNSETLAALDAALAPHEGQDPEQRRHEAVRRAVHFAFTEYQATQGPDAMRTKLKTSKPAAGLRLK